MALGSREKAYLILLNTIPILLMIGLIPLVKNDYFLALACVAVIAVSFAIHREKQEYIFFIFGFVAMTLFEMFFIAAGSEKFLRTSLLGLMPIWLPLMWGYAFVAMKRGIKILEK